MTLPPPSRHESALWQVIRVCGSLRLAMASLLVIALACAAATVCESRFNTQAAQEWFYDAPWFLFWLGLLCVNLLCATLVRWPWRRRHWGFVATHYGIVILLAGAMIGRKFGAETSLRLHTAAGAFQEKQMVFADADPVVVNQTGVPSGYRISLSKESEEPRVTVELPPLRPETFGLFSVLGKPISLQGDSTQILVNRYWPDFVMKGNSPATRSPQPNNPAILVALSGTRSNPEAAIGHVFGFQVELLRFDLPKNEGTDNPSDFRSAVRFTNPATHETHDAVISMNHPACFPAGFWRTALGRNYKFAQAQWNPNDVGETTFQVLHDPGWPFKWLGSLLVCAGIAGMFYLK